MTTVLAFRCDALRSKLSVASCAANYLAANGQGKSYANDGMRHGLHARQAGLAPCVGCSLGAEHAETGKARSGLHLTVLGQDPPVAAATAPALAPVVEKPFEDVKPSGVPDARTNSHAAIAAELREIVKERLDAGATRSTPWPARAKALAVELCERYGVKQRELEAIGLNYFTVRGWVRELSADRAGDALNDAVSKLADPPTRRLKPAPKAPEKTPEPTEEEQDVPEPTETPELPPAAEARTSASSRPLEVSDDDVIDLCERAGLGYRHTQAVLAIVLRNPVGAFRILAREIDRLGAAR